MHGSTHLWRDETVGKMKHVEFKWICQNIKDKTLVLGDDSYKTDYIILLGEGY